MFYILPIDAANSIYIADPSHYFVIFPKTRAVLQR